MKKQPVMMVEDNECDRDLTCFVFDHEQVLNDVIMKHDSEAALDYLFGKTDGTPAGTLPVMIILDLNLPGTRGIEILKRIRADERTSKVPVIVFTSSELEADREESLLEGATEFVHKSGDHRKFIASVKKMVSDWLSVKSKPAGEDGGHVG